MSRVSSLRLKSCSTSHVQDSWAVNTVVPPSTRSALPGSAKVSSFDEYPAKGRATGGVRAHRFLRGEDALTLAWVGANPQAVGTDGAVRALPTGGARRDGSGTALDGVVGAVGAAIR